MTRRTARTEFRRYRPYIAVLVGVVLVAFARPPMATQTASPSVPLRPSTSEQTSSAPGAPPSVAVERAAGFASDDSSLPQTPQTRDGSPAAPPPGVGAGDVPESDLDFLIPELPSELDPLLSVASPAAAEVCTVGGLVQALAALVAGLGDLASIMEGFTGFPFPVEIAVPPEAVELVSLALQVCGAFPVGPTITHCETDDAIVDALFSEEFDLQGMQAILKPQILGSLVDMTYAIEYLPAYVFVTPLLILAPLLGSIFQCETEETGFGP